MQGDKHEAGKSVMASDIGDGAAHTVSVAGIGSSLLQPLSRRCEHSTCGLQEPGRKPWTNCGQWTKLWTFLKLHRKRVRPLDDLRRLPGQ